MCSKCLPPSATQTRARFLACLAILRIAVSPKFSANDSTSRFMSLMVWGFVFLKWSEASFQNTKSIGDKSGEFAGQWWGVFPRDRIMCPNFDLRKSIHFGHMASCTILLVPVLSCWYQYCHSCCLTFYWRPKIIFEQFQVCFAVIWALEPHNSKTFPIDDSCPNWSSISDALVITFIKTEIFLDKLVCCR